MLGEHAGDLVVHHDHLIGVAVPLAGEHAHGSRAAAGPHALLVLAVQHRRGTRLDHQLRATVHSERRRLAVAEVEQGAAGHRALALRAAGEVAHAAEGEHLGAVFCRGDMADGLAVGAHRGLLRADVAVGVDLHLHAAVAEDPLRDDGHHVHARRLARDDEGRRLVIGIGGAGADSGDEALGLRDQAAAPVLGAVHEGHQGLCPLGDQ